LCQPSAPATCASGNSVTFYQSYDNGTTLDIAGGSKTPRGSPAIIAASGLFGPGIHGDTTSEVSYEDPTGTSISLAKPGSLSYWVKTDDGHIPMGFQVFDGFSRVNFFAVDHGSIGAGVDVYFHIGNATGPQTIQTAPSWVPLSSWANDGRWHLVVINWSAPKIGVSVDGGPLALTDVDWMQGDHVFASGVGSLIYAGGTNVGPGGYRGVGDEMIVLNRPMTTAEIQWYWGQRTAGGPTVKNPAVAHFNATPAACNQWDDLNPCTADACSVASGPTHTPTTDPLCLDGNARAFTLRMDGVVDAGNGHFVAVFGYDNKAGAYSATTNQVSLDGTTVANPAPAPPAQFPTGNHAGAYLGRFDAGHTLGWRVDDLTVSASQSAPNLEKIPIGTNGYGVMIDGVLVTIQPDTCALIDDQNPCTADTCDPVLGPVHTALGGISCDDGNACNGVAMCNAGVCVPGAPPTANDGNPCTADSCDPSAGVAHVPVTNGTACNDDNACTAADGCQAGVCVGANPVACAAPDLCHLPGACNPSTGACSYLLAPSGTGCSDGNACNGIEACDQYGVCRSGTPVLCVGSAGCDEAPTCDPVSGACSNPGGTDCTVHNAGTPPGVGASVANVSDPTPFLEFGCVRLRDIPVRFLHYGGQLSDSPVEAPAYRQAVIQEISDSFAKACLTFHDRAHSTILGPPFDNRATEIHFDIPAERDTWKLGAPYNSTCKLVLPTEGMATADVVLAMVMQECPLNDEMVIVSMAGRSGGESTYPSRSVNANGGGFTHEVGHQFSLWHAHEWVQWHKATADLLGEPQTAEDWWDLVYLPGDEGVPDKFYRTREAVHADIEAEKASDRCRNNPGACVFPNSFFANYRHHPFGLTLPGTLGATNYDLPPKTAPTGDPSCDNPPAPPSIPTDPMPFLGPCSAEPGPQARMRQDRGDGYCFLCEYRRMYEEYQTRVSLPTPFPPPLGRPLGFLFAPGLALEEWREYESFPLGFAGFRYENGFESNGEVADPVRPLAPRMTLLQSLHTTSRMTKNAMTYWQTFWTAGGINDYMKTPGFSASQVELIKHAFKYDFQTTTGVTAYPLDPPNFGHRPAYGSWEMVGQNLTTGETPAIVATPGGAFMAAKTTDGQIAYRHWKYADPPWTSVTGGGTQVSSLPWRTLLATSPRSPFGWLSAAYRPSRGGVSLAIHQVAGALDEIQHQFTTSDDGGLFLWASLGGLGGTVRGSPLSLTRNSPQGERFDVFTLTAAGSQGDSTYSYKEWSNSAGWGEWQTTPPLPGMRMETFDASARPDGTIDLVAVASDLTIRNLEISDASGISAWGDLGLPPGWASVSRPSVSTYVPPSAPSSGQTVFAVTDLAGEIWYKAKFQGSWYPGPLNWFSIGGHGFGRASISHNSNGDMDVVARDLERGTVRFKRKRKLGSITSLMYWSPSQSEWFDLGQPGVGDPVAIPRPGAGDVVDVFSLSSDGTLWHRAFVVPPFVLGANANPYTQQYEIDYATYCCSQLVANPACPCIP
jgi:hypothetical protein